MEGWFASLMFWFSDTWHNVKAAIISVFVTLTAYFMPIQDYAIAIIVMFLGNFLAGYFAGLIKQSETFDRAKAFRCFIEVAVYLGIMSGSFFVGDRMDDTDPTLTLIYGITYAFIWYYATNILKNLKRLFPNSSPIRFLYFIISIEFVKKIPFMSDFQNYEQGNEQTNNTASHEL